VPADLQAVAVRPDVVGMMDGPGRQPQDLALERAQQRQALGLIGGSDSACPPVLLLSGMDESLSVVGAAS